MAASMRPSSELVEKREICFATMAVGREYRALASLLLQDIAVYCPGHRTFVLTDEPSFLAPSSTTTAVSFTDRGYWFLYYGKLQAIRAAMAECDICIFLDADCRLIDRPPLEELLRLPHGAYGAYVQTVPYKVAGDHAMFLERGGKERWLRNTPHRQLRVYTELGKGIGVDPEDCNFLHESCLIFVGKESSTQLLDAWDYLGRGASSRFLEWGEGYTLGLALRLLNLCAGQVPRAKEWIFKDLLLSPDEGAQPRAHALLAQRKALAPSSSPSRLARVVRLLRGLYRYLCSAPLWLMVGEVRMRQRLMKTVARSHTTDGK